MCGGGGGGGGGWETVSDGDLQNVSVPSWSGLDESMTTVNSETGEMGRVDQWKYDLGMNDYNSAQAEIQRRADLRAQIAAQEKAMRETQAQIQQNLVDAQAKQVQQEAAQRKQVAELQAQQAQRTGEINASGQAVTSSLQILGNSGGKQGPTAAVAPKVKGRVSASSSNPTGLRIGSTMTGSGVGTNLGT